MSPLFVQPFLFSFSNFSFIFNYKKFLKRGKKKKVEWEQKREKGPIWSHFRAFYGFNKAEVIHKRPHIHLCRMNGLSTLKVATFDGAFFMSNDVGEHKIFFFGDFAIFFLLLVCWQFIEWTFWWQFLFRLSSNVKTSQMCVCMSSICIHRWALISATKDVLSHPHFTLHVSVCDAMMNKGQTFFFLFYPLTHFPLWTWVCKKSFWNKFT